MLPPPLFHAPCPGFSSFESSQGVRCMLADTAHLPWKPSEMRSVEFLVAASVVFCFACQESRPSCTQHCAREPAHLHILLARQQPLLSHRGIHGEVPSIYSVSRSLYWHMAGGGGNHLNLESPKVGQHLSQEEPCPQSRGISCNCPALLMELYMRSSPILYQYATLWSFPSISPHPFFLTRKTKIWQGRKGGITP